MTFIFLVSLQVHGQKIQGKLLFTPGKAMNMQMDLKATVTQQALGNAISFETDASALHVYEVVDTINNQTTLQHKCNKITFKFDGMGQKRSFNSDDSIDLAGQFGEPVKNILAKRFKMTIDKHGNVVMTSPAKIEPVIMDERQATVMNMIRDISDMVYPPQKGEASFFKVLPGKEIVPGESWSDSSQKENGNFKTIYTLKGVTDSTLTVEFKSTAVTIIKAIVMGSETTTTLNSAGYGKIVIDKATGIIKEKISTTESGGSMEAMGGVTPVTSKTTVTIHINPG